MTEMKNYDTVIEALNALKEQGYTIDFNVSFDEVICQDSDSCLNPADFKITEVYRFEGTTDPGDEAVVYGISSKDGKKKGVFLNAYGTYSTAINTQIIQKLSMQAHE